MWRLTLRRLTLWRELLVRLRLWLLLLVHLLLPRRWWVPARWWSVAAPRWRYVSILRRLLIRRRNVAARRHVAGRKVLRSWRLPLWRCRTGGRGIVVLCRLCRPLRSLLPSLIRRTRRIVCLARWGHILVLLAGVVVLALWRLTLRRIVLRRLLLLVVLLVLRRLVLWRLVVLLLGLHVRLRRLLVVLRLLHRLRLRRLLHRLLIEVWDRVTAHWLHLDVVALRCLLALRSLGVQLR